MSHQPSKPSTIKGRVSSALALAGLQEEQGILHSAMAPGQVQADLTPVACPAWSTFVYAAAIPDKISRLTHPMCANWIALQTNATMKSHAAESSGNIQAPS